MLSSIASLPASEQREALNRIAPTHYDKERLLTCWALFRARGSQMPPEGDWLVWLLLAGRGFGKTRTGAETVRAAVEHGLARRIALVGPTAADVRDVMVRGESGILAVSPPRFSPVYQPSNRRLTWPNGAVALCYSADQPERLRGPQHDLAWADELAAWRRPEAWDMLLLGLRLGDDPWAVVTTTPKPRRLIRDLAAMPTTVVTRGSTFDNLGNLAPAFLSAVVGRYEGTNLGRQEIYAELIEEAEGALWTRAMVEAARAPAGQAPPLSRVIVAIDPAVTHGEKSDETGIVVAGLGEDATVYVLADGSGKLAPDAWARRAVSLYELHRADRVIGETNNGGELVELTVRAVAPRIPYRGVTASRGKRARAEPISALYAQGKVRHVGAFPALEDQMCNWVPGAEDFSPDRLDALVWAISELVYGGGDTGMLDFYRAQAGKR